MDISDPFHNAWNDVDPEHKRDVHDRMLVFAKLHCYKFFFKLNIRKPLTVLTMLQDWFNLDYNHDDDIICSIVDREAAKCYNHWKSDLHDHFRALGGVANEKVARFNPLSLPPTPGDPQE